jgi:hypothetical protein
LPPLIAAAVDAGLTPEVTETRGGFGALVASGSLKRLGLFVSTISDLNSFAWGCRSLRLSISTSASVLYAMSDVSGRANAIREKSIATVAPSLRASMARIGS